MAAGAGQGQLKQTKPKPLCSGASGAGNPPSPDVFPAARPTLCFLAAHFPVGYLFGSSSRIWVSSLAKHTALDQATDDYGLGTFDSAVLALSRGILRCRWYSGVPLLTSIVLFGGLL